MHPKVLILSTSNTIGGAERIVCNLTRKITAKNWRVQMVCPQTSESDDFVHWCYDQQVKVKATTAMPHLFDQRTRQTMFSLRHFLKDEKSDIVNFHFPGNWICLKDIIAARFAGRHRCVITVHHPSPWDSTNEDKRRATRLAGILSHAVVTVSQATRDILIEAGIPLRKIHLILCGLCVPEVFPDQRQARQSLGLPPDAFVISSLARLVSDKGMADLIKAVAQMPDPQNNIRLVIAGDGPERADLEELGKKLMQNRIIFTGRVPNIDELYAATDVFALASYLEGFGLVYVEAAFHGIPSVGTNVGGTPDAVITGVTGLLVSPGDISALTEALQKLWSDPELCNRLGAAAKKRAYEEFTETVMADRYEELWMSLLRPKGRQAISHT